MRQPIGRRIVTLTLNPAVDLSFKVDELDPTKKLRCYDVRRDPGGGGVNVARAIHRLGEKATALLVVGGASGELLTSLLKAEGTPFHPIEITGETRENVTAQVADGGQYRFVMPGPRITRRNTQRIHQMLDALDPAPSILVASGSLPPGAPLDLYAQFARRAQTMSSRFAVDASGEALSRAIVAKPWLIKPNLAELEDLVGRPLPDLNARLAACLALNARGVETVALTLGSEGAMLVSTEGAWIASAPSLVPVSTVGAGDSFMAGLVKSLAEDAPPPQALRRAVAAGSAALLAPGTQLCDPQEVERIFAGVTVKSLPPSRGLTLERPRPAQA